MASADLIDELEEKVIRLALELTGHDPDVSFTGDGERIAAARAANYATVLLALRDGGTKV